LALKKKGWTETSK